MEDDILDQNAEAYNLKRNTVIMMKDRHCILSQEENEIFLPDDEILDIYNEKYFHIYEKFVQKYANRDGFVLRSNLTQLYEYDNIGAEIMEIPNGGNRRVLVHFFHKKENKNIVKADVMPLVERMQNEYRQPLQRLVFIANRTVAAGARKTIDGAATEQYNYFSEKEILEFSPSNVYVSKLQALTGDMLRKFKNEFKEITKLPQYGTNDRQIRHYGFPPKTIVRVHRENIITQSLISEYDSFGVVRYEKQVLVKKDNEET